LKHFSYVFSFFKAKMLHGYLGLDVSVATNIVSKVVGFILELSFQLTTLTISWKISFIRIYLCRLNIRHPLRLETVPFKLKCGFEGAEGDFELSVVGFLGGDALHEEAGGNEEFYEIVAGVPGAPLEDLIRGTADHWEPEEAEGEVGEKGLLLGQKHVGEDRYDEDENDEARSASRVEAGLLLCVFYLEVETFFVGPDGFVFGPVILEDPFHFFREEHEGEISDEDCELYDTVDEVEDEVMIFDGREDFFELRCDEERDEFEKKDTHSNGYDKREGEYC